MLKINKQNLKREREREMGWSAYCNPWSGCQGLRRRGNNRAILPNKSCRMTYWTATVIRIQRKINKILISLKPERLQSSKEEQLTVSVRWSRLTEVKRRRSLQQNLRIVVIFLEFGTKKLRARKLTLNGTAGQEMVTPIGFHKPFLHARWWPITIACSLSN